MKTLIINDSEDTIPDQFLESWVVDVAAELQNRKLFPETKKGKELSLVFLKEIDAKQLNWTHRQKDYATDVLSFETEDPESVGELVLCPIVLRKQAKDRKHPFEHELGYMVLHGILHLFGYDHEVGEEKAREMTNLQDGIFETLLELRRPKKVKKEKAVKGKVQGKKAGEPVKVPAAKGAKSAAKPAKAIVKPPAKKEKASKPSVKKKAKKK